MSSHREAPEIAQDPVADSTDLYAFVSPDVGGTVTILANYVPLQGPAGGPNFYQFGDDVLYQILIDNNGDAQPEITYQFQFTTVVENPNTFLYNTGPIASLEDPHWNRRQSYTVTRIDAFGSHLLASGLSCPPCNIGPLSTPNYGGLAAQAIHGLPGGGSVFAGQRAEGFYVDLGAIFDLGDLRPFAAAHTPFGMSPLSNAGGVNATKNVNVHSIALQLPISLLTRDGSTPTDVTDPRATIGVWTTASRQQVQVRGQGAFDSGPFVQVSRLGNPLVNEVVIPMGQKDYWNTQSPAGDSQFQAYYTQPELAGLLPVLYPGVFPNLGALVASGAARADLVAILLTGIPAGVVPGFQNTTGNTLADMLRLNMAIPPAGSPNIFGLIGGDPAGFPNGRRVFDDVTTIELRAIAGATYPLVAPSYSADGAAGAIYHIVNSNDPSVIGTENYLGSFPYLGQPYAGFDVPADNSPSILSSY
ncbi:MAG TPA: DUF4331 domain-containing protein [Acidimicrobiales bacterium]|nr:DUF4331 domain-containing protein [Acidimicrobiales bacterium]